MSDKDIIQTLNTILEECKQKVKGCELVYIATLDGHIITKVFDSSNTLDVFSPMTGSLLGISETIAKVNHQKLYENITIMENNILGLFKIYDEEDTLFLGVLCGRISNIAKMINSSHNTVDDINGALAQLG